MASEDGGGTGVQLGDWLGTSRAFWSYTGGGFGQSGAHAPFGESYALSSGYAKDFTGQQTFDGVTYAFPERYYHSTQGRWLSPDPAGGGAANVASPQSWNRYAYVRNNPLALVDPLGLDCATAGLQSVTINAGDCPGVDPNNEYYVDCDGCLMSATNAFVDQEGALILAIGTTSEGGQLSQAIENYGYTAPDSGNSGGLDPNSALGWTWNFTKSLFSWKNITDQFREGGCVNVFMNELSGAAAGPTAAGRDQAIEAAGKATGYTAALVYASNRGLTVPMRSSVVRNYLNLGEEAGTAGTLFVADVELGAAFTNEMSAMLNGECH